jgi:predicted PurR-regulated permease PerM
VKLEQTPSVPPPARHASDGSSCSRTRAASPVQLLAYGALAIATVAIIVIAARVLLVLFAGFLLAVFLTSAGGLIAKYVHVSPRITTALLIVVGLGLAVLACISFAPEFAKQIDLLARQLPIILDRLRHVLPRPAQPLLQALTGGGGPQPSLSAAGGALFTTLGGSVQVLGSVVVVFFVGVYGALQPQLYVQALLAVVPARHEDRVRAVIGRVHHDLARWLFGRVVAMAFVAVSTTIAFALLGLPLAPALGLFAGTLTFVEYLGALLSAVPPLLVGLADSPETAIWVLVVFTALHVVEGYVLTPALARASVHFPPALSLAAQLVLGVLAGPLGLAISTPFLVVIVSGVQAWREAPLPQRAV